MDVAVLGMGSMGRAVALRLVEEGHGVTVWNRTWGRADEVVSAGGREVGSPAEAAEGTQAVLVSVSDDDAVRSIVFGDDGEGGLSASLGGAVLVDLSTVAPATSRQEAAGVPQGRFVASPILGSPQAVRDGQAAYLLGGPQPLVEELEPLWASLSAVHRWCGEDPGTATTLKVLANYLLMSGIAVLSEAVATGQQVGLDDQLLREFLTVVPLVAPALHNRLDDVVDGDHRGWFSTALGAKDVRLMNELAATAGLRLPVAALVEERYRAAAEAGLSEADIGAVVELLR